MYGNLFTNEEFEEMLEEGYVRARTHPEADLFILNYTEKAAYEGLWNNVTLNCRGLIVDLDGNIIARPFPKFFNYGQTGCPTIDLGELATVSDKMDGSLGILYPIDNEWAIATRGSFESEQAIHATKLLRTKYADFKPNHNWTYLFEIVYPENRIVCNYDDLDDLVFLGAVHTNGRSYDADVAEMLNWRGPKAEIFPYKTMREALSAPPREGKEGFVVHLLHSDVRVKIKQEDYIALHRIVTGLNARSVWEAMLTDSVDELIEKIPDEFHDFIRGVEQDISSIVEEVTLICRQTYDGILDELGDNPTKKEFAMAAKSYPYSWALFNMFENKDISKKWLQIYKPAHNYSPIKADNDSN